MAATLEPCNAGCPQFLGLLWELAGGCAPKKCPGVWQGDFSVMATNPKHLPCQCIPRKQELLFHPYLKYFPAEETTEQKDS